MHYNNAAIFKKFSWRTCKHQVRLLTRPNIRFERQIKSVYSFEDVYVCGFTFAKIKKLTKPNPLRWILAYIKLESSRWGG